MKPLSKAEQAEGILDVIHLLEELEFLFPGKRIARARQALSQAYDDAHAAAQRDKYEEEVING